MSRPPSSFSTRHSVADVPSTRGTRHGWGLPVSREAGSKNSYPSSPSTSGPAKTGGAALPFLERSSRGPNQASK